MLDKEKPQVLRESPLTTEEALEEHFKDSDAEQIVEEDKVQ